MQDMLNDVLMYLCKSDRDYMRACMHACVHAFGSVVAWSGVRGVRLAPDTISWLNRTVRELVILQNMQQLFHIQHLHASLNPSCSAVS